MLGLTLHRRGPRYEAPHREGPRLRLALLHGAEVQAARWGHLATGLWWVTNMNQQGMRVI